MQQEFPMTVIADGNFSKSLNPLLAQLEMWLNFQALKTDWYANEACVLTFSFTLVNTLASKAEQIAAPSWVQQAGVAYHHDSDKLATVAFIAVADIVQAGAGIEQAIKDRLLTVANEVGRQHGLQSLS
ncbi:hypothetical protein FLM48_16995 [Shewanella sp. Scap07]|uniref:hypothetical protein n=1 Tax=Shewanella sp. Scap07 TaxID=2589987 RepID=UPI0015BAE6E0|nr:hypothetical protein [Shewanella sp. Scap07]QLE86618.1 hypothetical protein FLM48_16995 [Shewanella sp. Scap07]